MQEVVSLKSEKKFKAKSKAKKDRITTNKIISNPTPVKRKLSKSGKPVFYHKQSTKWQQTHKSPFMRLPDEVRLNIARYFYQGVRMIDKTRTQVGDFRRRFGAQNLALVCKSFKPVAEEAMYEQCTFMIHHFRLHPKQRNRNPLKTVPRIHNLFILWEPLHRLGITTTKLSVDLVMSMHKLEVVIIDLRALSIESVERGDVAEELQQNIVRHFKSRTDILPKWTKELIINTTKADTFVVYYFMIKVTSPMGPVFHGKRVQWAMICCNTESIVQAEIAADSIEQLKRSLCSRPYSSMLSGASGYQRFERKIPQKFRKLQSIFESV